MRDNFLIVREIISLYCHSTNSLQPTAFSVCQNVCGTQEHSKQFTLHVFLVCVVSFRITHMGLRINLTLYTKMTIIVIMNIGTLINKDDYLVMVIIEQFSLSSP